MGRAVGNSWNLPPLGLGLMLRVFWALAGVSMFVFRGVDLKCSPSIFSIEPT